MTRRCVKVGAESIVNDAPFTALAASQRRCTGAPSGNFQTGPGAAGRASHEHTVEHKMMG
eukprot:1008301-Pelagomonas_calceolata.AAC.7